MNKSGLFLFFLNFIFLAVQSNAQDSAIARKKYITQQLNGAITLDGVPDEVAWNAIEWGGDFTQYQPNEGKPPS